MPTSGWKRRKAPVAFMWRESEFSSLYCALRIYGLNLRDLRRRCPGRSADDIKAALASRAFFKFGKRRGLTGDASYSSSYASLPFHDDDDHDDHDASKGDEKSENDEEDSDFDDADDEDEDEDEDDLRDGNVESEETASSNFILTPFGFACSACGQRDLSHVCPVARPADGAALESDGAAQAMQRSKKKKMSMAGKRVNPHTLIRVILNNTVLREARLIDCAYERAGSEAADPEPIKKRRLTKTEAYEKLAVGAAVSRARAEGVEGRRQAKFARKLARDVGRNGQNCGADVTHLQNNELMGVYSGQVNANEQAHGCGVAVGPDGHTFAGQWAEGLPDGRGQYTFSNGNTYAGNVAAGKLHGHGVLTFSSGVVFYEGQWESNEIQGRGKQFTASGSLVHEGSFAENKAVIPSIH